MNCKITIYVISWEEFQVYRVIQALVIQVLFFFVLFLGEKPFLITPLLEVRQGNIFSRVIILSICQSLLKGKGFAQ